MLLYSVTMPVFIKHISSCYHLRCSNYTYSIPRQPLFFFLFEINCRVMGKTCTPEEVPVVKNRKELL